MRPRGDARAVGRLAQPRPTSAATMASHRRASIGTARSTRDGVRCSRSDGSRERLGLSGSCAPPHTARVVITVRRAEASDAPTLRAIFRAASLGNAGDRAALSANPDALVWDASAIERAIVLVAVDAAQVLGFATAIAGEAAWELDDLFVAPQMQRRGAGRALVEALVDMARDADATQLSVTGNPHALAFYAAAGFVEAGRVQTRFGPAPRLTHRFDR